jgi:RNA polymerase sigma-70 factor (ECF subfamily)
MAGVTCEPPLPVREARTGDPDAWNALFKRYQLPLYVYVFELVRDEQASLDIVQETFVNAARHIERLREDEKFGAWLFSIAHQKCLQHWRKRKPEMPFEDAQAENLADEDLDPEQWLIHKEQEEEFMALLNQLSWPHRSVLVLHFLEEFSLEEIAGICGLALGTVKSRLHYAKKALRKLLLQQS